MSARHRGPGASSPADLAGLVASAHHPPPSAPVFSVVGFQVQQGHVVVLYRRPLALQDESFALSLDAFMALHAHITLALLEARGVSAGRLSPEQAAHRASVLSGSAQEGQPQ